MQLQKIAKSEFKSTSSFQTSLHFAVQDTKALKVALTHLGCQGLFVADLHEGKKAWQQQPGGGSLKVSVKVGGGVTTAEAAVIVRTASVEGQSSALPTAPSSMHPI